jgi:hypothetical protein
VQGRQQLTPCVGSWDRDILWLVRVRENNFRAHIAIEASRISASNAGARPRITAIGAGIFAGVARSVRVGRLTMRQSSSTGIAELQCVVSRLMRIDVYNARAMLAFN